MRRHRVDTPPSRKEEHFLKVRSLVRDLDLEVGREECNSVAECLSCSLHSWRVGRTVSQWVLSGWYVGGVCSESQWEADDRPQLSLTVSFATGQLCIVDDQPWPPKKRGEREREKGTTNRESGFGTG